MRLEGASAVIREGVPAEYVDVAVFASELGGTTVLMLVLALSFWLTRRRESALVISYAVAGVALVVGLKAAIGLPRPPESVMVFESGYAGYGVPSGHAFAATLVYGGFVTAFEVTRRRLAILGVSVLVTLVSLSRVVLGVHYLGDVIAGVAVGVGFLLALDRLTAGDPRRGFAVGIGLAIPAVIVTGVADDAVLALGGSIGGFLASSRLESLPTRRSTLEGGLLVVAGSTAIGFVLVIEPVVATIVPAAVVLYAVLFAAILLVPIPVRHIENARRRGARTDVE